ncbi:hypothetical protein CYLTODRAFT_424177 [Cylindrobasidium torrendii FP15055 ss-10]|uniref:Uncharacterized protein n=1 Tax=Cylindrobasidium torrendii FP15055 ss-10 TaxID=1314674 RepID=A0A0D7B565_9AGAR|nr:hypothetical protein CYLTODRAFT_424177 [Cylindrobasidium torrendii FP15055 ss-10]
MVIVDVLQRYWPALVSLSVFGLLFATCSLIRRDPRLRVLKLRDAAKRAMQTGERARAIQLMEEAMEIVADEMLDPALLSQVVFTYSSCESSETRHSVVSMV